LHAGEKLKELRTRLGVSMRDVEQYSRQIAEAEGNSKYFVSSAWLSEIESTGAIPSVHKLYSMTVVCRISFFELLAIFGISLEKISRYRSEMPLSNTHFASLEVYEEGRAVTFPAKFDKQFKLEHTALLSRIVKLWGDVPIAVIRHLNFRDHDYGYIGLKDLTMDPLLPPGSFVQIDTRVREVSNSPWKTEFDRPLYFVKVRSGYVCSWCELKKKYLTLVPHPLSKTRIRRFAYPDQAQVVGRVTGIAMRVVRSLEPSSDWTAKSSGQFLRLTKTSEQRVHRIPKES
jgi:transcriptional regulator with XRE-family HTH domain